MTASQENRTVFHIFPCNPYRLWSYRLQWHFRSNWALGLHDLRVCVFFFFFELVWRWSFFRASEQACLPAFVSFIRLNILITSHAVGQDLYVKHVIGAVVSSQYVHPTSSPTTHLVYTKYYLPRHFVGNFKSTNKNSLKSVCTQKWSLGQNVI